jgi:hypothetical protein
MMMDIKPFSVILLGVLQAIISIIKEGKLGEYLVE